MAFTQGAPLPDIKETTTRTTGAPDYYTNYLSGLSQAGQKALGQTAETGIAGMTDLQKKGYAALPTAAGAYIPGLTAAEKTAASASGISSEDITNFMNPYTKNVVDEMARLSQQNVQRNLLPTLKAGFVGTGGLGSQRYAGALGQGLADVQANLTGQQYGALSSGYNEAVKAALNEAQLQNQVAQTQGQLARAEQELGLTGAGALTKAGAEQQAFEQAKLDFPLKQATNVSNLLRNYTMPTSETTTFVGPKAGAYQTSGLANIMGMLSLLGSAKSGSLLEQLGNRIIGGIGGGSVTPTNPSGGTPGYDWTTNPNIDWSNPDTWGGQTWEDR